MFKNEFYATDERNTGMCRPVAVMEGEGVTVGGAVAVTLPVTVDVTEYVIVMLLLGVTPAEGVRDLLGLGLGDAASPLPASSASMQSTSRDLMIILQLFNDLRQRSGLMGA